MMRFEPTIYSMSNKKRRSSIDNSYYNSISYSKIYSYIFGFKMYRYSCSYTAVRNRRSFSKILYKRDYINDIKDIIKNILE
jgi:hypothetical protein